MGIERYISDARKRERATLNAFAIHLGVSTSYLCDVEHGRRTVSIRRAVQWARRLDQPASRLVALVLQSQLDAEGLPFNVQVVETRS